MAETKKRAPCRTTSGKTQGKDQTRERRQTRQKQTQQGKQQRQTQTGKSKKTNGQINYYPELGKVSYRGDARSEFLPSGKFLVKTKLDLKGQGIKEDKGFTTKKGEKAYEMTKRAYEKFTQNHRVIHEIYFD